MSHGVRGSIELLVQSVAASAAMTASRRVEIWVTRARSKRPSAARTGTADRSKRSRRDGTHHRRSTRAGQFGRGAAIVVAGEPASFGSLPRAPDHDADMSVWFLTNLDRTVGALQDAARQQQVWMFSNLGNHRVRGDTGG
jgi:hypothetical protein